MRAEHNIASDPTEKKVSIGSAALYRQSAAVAAHQQMKANRFDTYQGRPNERLVI